MSPISDSEHSYSEISELLSPNLPDTSWSPEQPLLVMKGSSESSYPEQSFSDSSDFELSGDHSYSEPSEISNYSTPSGSYSPKSPATSLPESLIVMKGYPYTRKTEFAEIIANSLGCPLLSSEDFLHCITAPLSPDREFEAFKVICQIAVRHLDIGLFKNVVIDSPLSSESHFIYLTNCVFKRTRVVVIECKPANIFSWKLKFEQNSADLYPCEREVKWFKPKKWEDVEKARKAHPDYDVSSSLKFVSKLVVDPLLDCPFEYTSPGFVMYGSQPLVDAVRYMMSRDRGDGPDVVFYNQWLQQSISLSSSSSDPLHCTRHGHDLVPNSTAVEQPEGIQHEAVDCMFCERQVTRSNGTGDEYCYCRNCSFTLHMECALSSKTSLDRLAIEVEASRDNEAAKSRMESCACKPCKEAVSDRSISCKSCKINFHIRCKGAFPPVAIKHFDTKEHFLTILFTTRKEIYRCVACGQNRRKKLPYLCKDCGVAYHYECVTMPRRLKNVHGGHHHYLSLKFESEEAEDYLCQECQEFRDPALWYYSCEDCPGYEVHPHCVAKFRAEKRSRHSKIDAERMDGAEIKAAQKFNTKAMQMKESESISDFYSRVIYLIQWYGKLRDEAEFVWEILGSLPLKFYHAIVAIKRSDEYESMTVDQLMISLRLYEKKIDNGEDVLIEQALANLYASQRSSSRDKSYVGKFWYEYYDGEDDKLIMNGEDVSLKSVLLTDYTKQESGENWVKYWGKYWDNYWLNYQRGCYGKSEVQCSICYMFGHDSGDCWSVLKQAKRSQSGSIS